MKAGSGGSIGTVVDNVLGGLLDEDGALGGLLAGVGGLLGGLVGAAEPPPGTPDSGVVTSVQDVVDGLLAARWRRLWASCWMR
jgi:hypothetical protein